MAPRNGIELRSGIGWKSVLAIAPASGVELCFDRNQNPDQDIISTLVKSRVAVASPQLHDITPLRFRLEAVEYSNVYNA
ncbi:hypothetical protein EVAR_52753_1 [Eumeta japonica]|uniref:Uncharacterized protein n=1 Tax=Eumeta variegata TaxID=151549 RepID=A0A4C1XGC9_EUMVA|nr:hypothetical protein EVAR_52753_1 [Eumeta japonica]